MSRRIKQSGCPLESSNELLDHSGAKLHFQPKLRCPPRRCSRSSCPAWNAQVPLPLSHLCPSSPASLMVVFSLCVGVFLSSAASFFPPTLISFLQSSSTAPRVPSRPVSAAPLRAPRASSLFHNMADASINTRLKIGLPWHRTHREPEHFPSSATPPLPPPKVLLSLRSRKCRLFGAVGLLKAWYLPALLVGLQKRLLRTGGRQRRRTRRPVRSFQPH